MYGHVRADSPNSAVLPRRLIAQPDLLAFALVLRALALTRKIRATQTFIASLTVGVVARTKYRRRLLGAERLRRVEIIAPIVWRVYVIPFHEKVPCRMSR
jgi:hypothetical protein